MKFSWNPVDFILGKVTRPSLVFAHFLNLYILLRAAIGKRPVSKRHLHAIISAYRNAFKGLTPERAPYLWTLSQDNLGYALTELGRLEGGTECLEEALIAFSEALEGCKLPQYHVRTQSHLIYWARIQAHLGYALVELGRLEGGTARLEEAVTVCREALQKWPHERLPFKWPVRHNLVDALIILGEREGGTARLEEAIATCHEALKERTCKRPSLNWILTQINLAAALASLGEREGGSARLHEAIATCREVLKERVGKRPPLNWSIKYILGYALAILGEREGSTARLEEAIATCREALKEVTRERVPLDWARTQNNFGDALVFLGKRENSIVRLGEAVDAYRAAIEVGEKANLPELEKWKQNFVDAESSLRS